MSLITRTTILLAVAAYLCAPAAAQDEIRLELDDTSVVDLRTESPRQTLQSWLTLSSQAERLYEAYRADPSFENGTRLKTNAYNFLYLMDLSEVAPALRAEAGYQARYAILDILARIELPPIDSVPDWSAFDESAPSGWRLPGTPITIAKVDDDDRVTEYLFSAATVRDAPDYFKRIQHLPTRSGHPDFSWTDSYPQVSGPLFPPSLVEAMPGALTRPLFDTPIWKIIVSFVTLGASLAFILFVYRRTRRFEPESELLALAARSVIPVIIIALTWQIHEFIQNYVNVSGRFATFTDIVITISYYLAYAWLFWLAVRALVEWIIRSPHIPDDSLDANLLRLAAKVVGAVGVVVLLSLSADRLGIPVLGIIAGLGFGGLAIALAVRPTLENLLGGIVLYVDRPVTVGDFCSFGDRSGQVERIGVRSTKIRAQDRTLISIPNAEFSNYELVNWGECDQMLILATIALRYETTPDQLRSLLGQLKEMLDAHPQIDDESARVRFVGYGDSSLNIQLRAYANTTDWNEFYAIQEEVFLRVNALVAASGTSFAVPAPTVYFSRDRAPNAGSRREADPRKASHLDDAAETGTEPSDR